MALEVPPLAEGHIDRDAATRLSPDLLAAAWAESNARVLLARGPEVRVQGDEAAVRLVLTATEGEFTVERAEGRVGHVYLGRWDGAPMFATAVDPDDERAAEPPSHELTPEQREQGYWGHPFALGEHLSAPEAELSSIASALLRWHESSPHSPRDGGRTSVQQGGWARADENGGEHFPRTDPAVIVLIEHEDRVLLGSNTLWADNFYSLLAGFVEAGESLEQTVVREIYEEAGVRLGEVRYVASQPWPFPRSLMLGFRARLEDGVDPEALSPDTSEISDLRWFTRSELLDPDTGIVFPRGLSIAGWLLEQWIAEGDRPDGERE